MLNHMRDGIEGMYRGGEGTTPVTTACRGDLTTGIASPTKQSKQVEHFPENIIETGVW